MTVKHCFGYESNQHLLKDCRQAGCRSNGRRKWRISLVQAADKSKVASWIIERGTVSHLTNKKDLFSSLGALKQNCVSLANGAKSAVTGEESIVIPGLGKELKNLLVVPQLDCNIPSVPAFDKEGYAVGFENGKCTIKKGNIVQWCPAR